MPPPLRSRFWSDLTSEEFSRLDRDRLIAVLPVGATEQHGPHLPLSTDSTTIDALVRANLAPQLLEVDLFPLARLGNASAWC